MRVNTEKIRLMTQNYMTRYLMIGSLLVNLVFAGVTYEMGDLVENISTETCYPGNNVEWALYDNFGNVNGGGYKVVWIILFSAASHVSQIESEFTENIYNQYRDNGLTVVAAGTQWVDDLTCEEWATEHGISYPVIDDSDLIFRSLFTDGSVPHHVLLDHQMRVIFSQPGTIIPPTGNDFLSTLDNAVEDLESLLVVPHLKDWDMVGLPVNVSDASQSSVFPGSVEGTLFSFGETYESESEFIPGEGYWINFPYSGHTALDGAELSSLIISLNAGWNIISGISEETYIADIFDPGQIVVPGSLYGFNGTYVNASTLAPGKGYWINAFTSGNITIIPGGDSEKIRSVYIDHSREANVLHINDSKLYFGVSIPESELVYYQLPPTPPAGAFDVRFDTNSKIMKDYGQIEILNDKEYLTISAEFNISQEKRWDWVVISPEGKEYILSEYGSISLSGQITDIILKKIRRLPTQYTLSQNYPNPFNPRTTLNYEIPEQGDVRLTVYDLLGKEIWNFNQSNLSVGYHSVQWNGIDNDGSPLASGCYLYQLKVSSTSAFGSKPEQLFVQTRKMVLLK